ncbi:MAG: hypothetical protein IJW63_00065 [Lachnospiraceae bacterium]|nr:hypothetical protein [Lachnospiraceae bacterium]
MKFTIEKGLSIYDLNDAIKFFMAQHDFGEFRKVTIENDFVVNISAEDYWGDEIIGEYVISREYVDKIKEKKLREYEEECRKWILPELWENFQYEIENEIDRCEKDLRIVNKKIQDAPQKIKKKSTLEKCQNDKVKFEEHLRELQEVQKLYYALKEVKDKEYENINGNYGFVLMHNGKKYAFVHRKESDSGILLEIGENNLILLEAKGYSLYDEYSV